MKNPKLTILFVVLAVLSLLPQINFPLHWLNEGNNVLAFTGLLSLFALLSAIFHRLEAIGFIMMISGVIMLGLTASNLQGDAFHQFYNGDATVWHAITVMLSALFFVWGIGLWRIYSPKSETGGAS